MEHPFNNGAAVSDDEDGFSNQPVKPCLLFPSSMPSPTKSKPNPFILAGARQGSVSPVKQPAKRPGHGAIPPTPQSLRRSPGKKTHQRIKKGSFESVHEHDSDFEEDDLEMDWEAAFKSGQTDLITGGETFRPPSKSRVREGQEFARKAGGLFFR